MLSKHYLRLVLQILNLFWVFEATCFCFNVRQYLILCNHTQTINLFLLYPPQFRKLTWLEENYSFQTGELCRVHLHGLEAAKELLQETQVRSAGAAFTL